MQGGDPKGGVYVALREDVETMPLRQPGLVTRVAGRLRRIAHFIYQLLTES